MPARKPWWRSRVLRFNAALAVLGALDASTGALQALLPVDVWHALTVALAVGNALLRVLTTQPLGRGGVQ